MSAYRLAFPTVTQNGLGNTILAVAKAYLMAETCQMTYQPQVWPYCPHVKPVTHNGYGYYFPSSLADRIRLRLISYNAGIQRRLGVQLLWPRLVFTDQDYARTGITDVGEACLAYLKSQGLDDPSQSVVMTVGGMWGGYLAIRRAREWMRVLFLGHDPTRQRLEAIKAQTDGALRVCVQIRMGDFKARDQVGPIQRGERVVRLPLEWYARACRIIREHSNCHFVLVTDGTHDEVKPFLDEFNPVHLIGEPYQDLLGALLMADSDLVVCSNSTYSRLGCFLNDKPYIWPADSLYQDETGKFGYLWKDLGPPPPADDRSSQEAVRRCFALSIDFSDLPEGIIRYLRSEGTLPIEIADDLLYREPVYLQLRGH
jgi:hypothetical protein